MRLALGTTATVLLVGGGVGTLVERDLAARDRAEIDAHAGDLSRAQMLPATPARAVQALLLRAIAEDDPRAVCSAFSAAATAELATLTAAWTARTPSTACTPRSATWPATPARPRFGHRVDRPGRPVRRWERVRAHVDGSAEAPRSRHGRGAAPAGPYPGVLTGQRQLGQGYLVTGYRPC
ncbi:hypothetical protein Ae717Ps2_6584c [Pseudonocardia sp. Ae717_Ps2]|uniref:hypothetical protein n=1 Tax=Pseudonocardia sp. Ae717_Ps2 TaxID=1885573 RepID=UPI00095A3B5F|nr:hypothetical protein [Pseudonocardia sp. Ae717_Ps2]OLM28245.1 hypothetical protein Ae717Ps2_6584c [Pseudonocardia sp. Ae717_Ps2]